MVGPLLMIVGCQLAWHEFQSQLSPHAGSQKSPGHQLMLGPGCASASVAAAKPTHPKPAANTAVAAIQLANLFMRIWISGQAMCLPSRCWCSDEQLQTPLLLFILSCCSTSSHAWQVWHQKTFRPSNSAVRITVPHTRHGSPARRYT
jgi:hypothetical protein